MARINISGLVLNIPATEVAKPAPRADEGPQAFDDHLRRAGAQPAEPANTSATASSGSQQNQSPSEASKPPVDSNGSANAPSQHLDKSAEPAHDSSSGQQPQSSAQADKTTQDSGPAAPTGNSQTALAASAAAIGLAQHSLARQAETTTTQTDALAKEKDPGAKAVVADKPGQTTVVATRSKGNKQPQTSNAALRKDPPQANAKLAPDQKSSTDKAAAPSTNSATAQTKAATKSAAAIPAIHATQQATADQSKTAVAAAPLDNQHRGDKPQADASSHLGATSKTEAAVTTPPAIPDTAATAPDTVPIPQATAAVTTAAQAAAVAGAAGSTPPQSTAASGQSSSSGIVPVTESQSPGTTKSGTATDAKQTDGKPGGLSQADRVRLVQRVSRAFQTIGPNGGQLKLRLSPPELGSVKVDVSVHDGVMNAHLEAESESTRNLLVDNLPQLRERLSEQGIRIDRFDVDVMNQSAGGSPENPGSRDNQQQQSAGTPVPQLTRPASVTAATQAASAPRLSATGALDVLI